MSITQQQTAKTCATCNASYQNTVERVTRCGLCVATPTGNTKWQPGAVQHPQQEQPTRHPGCTAGTDEECTVRRCGDVCTERKQEQPK